MRKHLCRTVAFVALGLTTGLVATQANAESGLKLGITGFYRGAAGAVVGGSASPDPGSPIASTAGFGDFGRSSSGFRQEIRINITGQTTLDNGLTVGLLVGLDGENLAAVGGTATPSRQSFTPTVGGFTFAISYTPSGGVRNPGGGYFYGTDLRNGTAANVLSVGTDLSRAFGGTTVTVGGGGEWALDSYTVLGGPIADKPSTYQLGAQLGLNRFAIGASGAYVDNYKQAGYAATDAFSGDDAWIASAGASYRLAAWSLGLQGIYSRWQVYGDRDHDTVWGASLNSAYALGPGITLEGQLAYSSYDANGLFGPGPNAVPFPPFGFAAQPASDHTVEIDGGFSINF